MNLHFQGIFFKKVIRLKLRPLILKIFHTHIRSCQIPLAAAFM
jgi:hypothetical protein